MLMLCQCVQIKTIFFFFPNIFLEFCPGVPWKGLQNIDPETDPNVTPGSVPSGPTINTTIQDVNRYLLRDRSGGKNGGIHDVFCEAFFCVCATFYVKLSAELEGWERVYFCLFGSPLKWSELLPPDSLLLFHFSVDFPTFNGLYTHYHSILSSFYWACCLCWLCVFLLPHFSLFFFLICVCLSVCRWHRLRLFSHPISERGSASIH